MHTGVVDAIFECEEPSCPEAIRNKAREIADEGLLQRRFCDQRGEF